LGQRSAKASEKSAEASVAAAEAIERSVAASEQAAGLAAQDARVRRMEAVLDTLLEMRQLFSEQWAAHEDEVPEWKLHHHSPEHLARLDLNRKLQARLVPFDYELDPTNPTTSVPALARMPTENWGSQTLEQAVSEVSDLLRNRQDI
jgi:hypothetical protein